VEELSQADFLFVVCEFRGTLRPRGPHEILFAYIREGQGAFYVLSWQPWPNPTLFFHHFEYGSSLCVLHALRIKPVDFLLTAD